MTVPEITGADIKSFRHRLQLTVNGYAGLFGVSRQLVARLERLTRPLTRDEVMSIDLTKPAREGRIGRKTR
jgi:DNA-binding transcriptional regulator YiaG